MYLIFGLGLVAFILSLVLTPLVRDSFLRLGIVDQPDGDRKLHSGPIPRVGGIAIVLSYVTAFAVMLLLPFSYGSEVSKALPSIWKLFCAAGLVFATGLCDDLVGYFPWQKLAGQVWAGMIAYFAGVQIQVLPDHPLQLWWNIPLSILWLVGCTNAVNLIDGLDGLAAGVGLFATVTMLLAAFANHNLQLALVTMPLAGALIGFLRYNFNPASIFLGDCGSLFIGFTLAALSLQGAQKASTAVAIAIPLMAFALPVIDTTFSMMRRFISGKPLFQGDREHVHHMLLERGWSQRRTVFVLYAVSAALGLISLLFINEASRLTGLVLLVVGSAIV